MEYERQTNKDMTLNLNVNPQQDMTKYFVFTQRLWELENKIESGEIGDTKQAVREFAEKLEEIKRCVRDLNVCFDAEWRYLLEDTLDKIDELLAEVTGE